MERKTKFTVIIATRNRADTLKWALRTCVEQEYENFQIIVSDNFSKDNTKQVVELYNDKRIKYINTGRDLSMSHNYEFALSHVNDGYVTFMGDDDGLMPGALNAADEIISQTGYEAIIGRMDEYFWQSCTDIEKRGLLKYRIRNKDEEKDSKKTIHDVLLLKKEYQNLPCIYNVGFISYSAIKRVFDRSGGVFFRSCIPDVYSSFALASEIKKYLFVNRTFILVGISGHSNGIAYFDPKGEKKIANNFFELDTIPFHNKLTICPSMEVMYAESYLQATEANLFARGSLSLESVINVMMYEAINSPYQGNYEIIKLAVEDIARKNGLDDNFYKRMLRKYPEKRPLIKLIFNKIKNRILGQKKYNFIQCYTSKSEIQNIYDAVLLNHSLEVKKNPSFFQFQILLIKELINSGRIFLKKRIKDTKF